MSLVVARGLSRHFALGRSGPAGLFGPRRLLQAVSDVSFTLDAGQTLGVVGESGCGKTTLGRLVAGMDRASAGGVRFDGLEIAGTAQRGAAWRALRREIQVVYQNPLAALDPRIAIGTQISEPRAIHGLGHRRDDAAHAAEMLQAVGLPAEMAPRFPHELSGGQLQRVVIARAMVLHPRLVVCDEPVSALDVSVQAQVVNLMAELQARHGMAYLFISHDLKVVRHLSQRVAVMYLGRIVELAPRERLFAAPQHPYTQALLASVPLPNPRQRHRQPRVPLLRGEPPSPLSPPPGCAFHPRCTRAQPICREARPSLAVINTGHTVACHFPGT